MAIQKDKGISWAQETVNPIRARLNGRVGHYCEKISSGCANCYSSRMQCRFGMPAFKAESGAWLNDVIEPFLDESKLQDVLKRRKPTRFFWGDMTDLMGDWVKDEWLDRCFAVMTLTPRHTHMILTKRAERMQRYCSATTEGLNGIGRRLPILGNHDRCARVSFPLPNVWLGVTAENQAAADERIPLLLQTPAAVRFVSVEPLLGPIDLEKVPLPDGYFKWAGIAGCAQPLTEKDTEPDDYRYFQRKAFKIDWVISGGESGPKARPCHPDWIRSLRDQCQVSGVAFHFKQWGEWAEVGGDQPTTRHFTDEEPLPIGPKTAFISLDGEVIKTEDEMKEEVPYRAMRRVGKKSAGRMLDGREWLEFPKEFASC